MAKRKEKSAPKIVSSAHLAGNRVAELSEFEFALTPIFHAYGRWIVRCAAASGQGQTNNDNAVASVHCDAIIGANN